MKQSTARMKKVRNGRGCVNQDFSEKTLTDEAKRLRSDDFGGGARKAIEKSCVWLGDEGVTMMAGRGDFSVSDGSDRSLDGSDMSEGGRGLIEPTERSGNQRVIEAVRKTVKTGSWEINELGS